MQQSSSKRDRIAEYKELIARITPKSKLAQGCWRAFWVGGITAAIFFGFLAAVLFRPKPKA